MATKTGILYTDITVTIKGASDIMFDRFFGQEADTRPPEQKLYTIEDNLVVMPSENIYAFLLGEKPGGCAAMEGKARKDYMRLGAANIIITPDAIPFTRNGESLHFKKFDDEIFAVSQFAPRVIKGNLSIKQNVRLRPVLKTPWELTFNVRLVDNPKISPDKLYNWFTNGGLVVGLGTYRPRFGRFVVSTFDYKERD